MLKMRLAKAVARGNSVDVIVSLDNANVSQLIGLRDADCYHFFVVDRQHRNSEYWQNNFIAALSQAFACSPEVATEPVRTMRLAANVTYESIPTDTGERSRPKRSWIHAMGDFMDQNQRFELAGSVVMPRDYTYIRMAPRNGGTVDLVRLQGRLCGLDDRRRRSVWVSVGGAGTTVSYSGAVPLETGCVRGVVFFGIDDSVMYPYFNRTCKGFLIFISSFDSENNFIEETDKKIKFNYSQGRPLVDASGWEALLSPIAIGDRNGEAPSLTLYRLCIPCDRMFDASYYDGRRYQRLAFEDILPYVADEVVEFTGNHYLTGVGESSVADDARPPTLADITATWVRWLRSSERLVYDCPIPEFSGVRIARGLIAALKMIGDDGPQPNVRLPRSLRLLWCGTSGSLPMGVPATEKPTLGRFLEAFRAAGRNDPVKLSIGLVDGCEIEETSYFVPGVRLDEVEVYFHDLSTVYADRFQYQLNIKTRLMIKQLGFLLPPFGSHVVVPVRRLVLRFRLTKDSERALSSLLKSLVTLYDVRGIQSVYLIDETSTAVHSSHKSDHGLIRSAWNRMVTMSPPFAPSVPVYYRVWYGCGSEECARQPHDCESLQSSHLPAWVTRLDVMRRPWGPTDREAHRGPPPTGTGDASYWDDDVHRLRPRLSWQLTI